MVRSPIGIVSTPLQRGCVTLRSMNANFCILRAAKLTSLGNVAASAAHTFRERPTPNADPERTHLNDNRGALTTSEVVAAVQERVALAERTAKRPVLCVEYLVTASPEALASKSPAERQMYFDDALRWIEARHGKANVVCSSLQRDESTEHLVVYAVPLVEREAKQRKRSVIVGKGEDGKPIRETRLFDEPATVSLSAKEFLGGRERMRRMQTEFAEQVGLQHGLQRGVEGSKSVHKRNADIGAMSSDRLALRKRVNDLEDEIERLTQQVATSGGALAKAVKKADRQQEINVEFIAVERQLRGELAAAKATEQALRDQLNQALLDGAEAIKAATMSSGQVAVLVEELSKQGAALVAAQEDSAEAKRQLVAAQNALQAASRPAAVAAAPLDKAWIGKEVGTPVAPPATVEEAQRLAVKAEEKRLGVKFSRLDDRAVAIRMRVRKEWNEAEAARLAPPEPPRELEREKPKVRVVERKTERGGRD